MKLEAQRDLAHRTLDLLDRKTTVMAPHIMEEPLDRYTSPEHAELERREIFLRYPMFVGLSSDLPGPGSWRTFDATGTPMLLTRDPSGRFRAYLNMCQHRGVRVVTEPSGEGARRFTCPFHNWVYDTEGKLVGIPDAEGFDEVNREERGLIELPAEEGHGLLFAAASVDATFSLDEYLSGLDEAFDSFEFATWKPVAPLHEHRVRTNWKVVWGTHNETYHFAYLHRNTAAGIVYGNTSLADFYGDHALMTTTARSIDQLRESPEEEWRPVDDGQIFLNYRLFPNLSFSLVHATRLEIFQIFPGSNTHETIALHHAYTKELPSDEIERKQLEEQVHWACQNVVDAEDYRMAELADLGVHSPSAPRSLVFGRNEPVMQHMAVTLRRRLGLGDADDT